MISKTLSHYKFIEEIGQGSNQDMTRCIGSGVLTPPELNVFKRKNSSRAPSKLSLVVLLLSFSIGLAEKEETVVITSNPTGATIKANRAELATTPFAWKIGKDALNPSKWSIRPKLLEKPVVLELSKEGFVSRKIVITFPKIVNGVQFYIVTSTSFHFELDEIGGSVTDNPDQVDLEFPTPAEQISTADVPSPQRAIEAIIHNDTEDASSLMQAAHRGHTDVALSLLSDGAGLNRTAGGGWTALRFA
ncbi:MAG: ankyrin repeat domain-containing protein, partial [Acidobacteria bacterium]|nr:ankyrin repeat domain-containing protein [Acidobacteriota bacterium]